MAGCHMNVYASSRNEKIEVKGFGQDRVRCYKRGDDPTWRKMLWAVFLSVPNKISTVFLVYSKVPI